MTPRKYNSFFPELASELKLSETVIEDIIGFYWKEVQKQMNEPEHTILLLENFGIFEIRKRQVLYRIDKYKNIIKYAKPNTYNKYALLHQTENKLARLEKILELCILQEQRKQKVRIKQKNGKTV